MNTFRLPSLGWNLFHWSIKLMKLLLCASGSFHYNFKLFVASIWLIIYTWNYYFVRLIATKYSYNCLTPLTVWFRMTRAATCNWKMRRHVMTQEMGATRTGRLIRAIKLCPKFRYFAIINCQMELFINWLWVSFGLLSIIASIDNAQTDF